MLAYHLLNSTGHTIIEDPGKCSICLSCVNLNEQVSGILDNWLIGQYATKDIPEGACELNAASTRFFVDVSSKC